MSLDQGWWAVPTLLLRLLDYGWWAVPTYG